MGYGAWQIGGNMWGEVPDRAAEQAIEAALDAGITFFDTALAYGRGRSEQVLGRVLKRTGMRETVKVATKIPPMNSAWPARHDAALRDVFPAHWIEQCTRESLANLGFTPDLQQLHVWSDTWADDREWSDALERLKQNGDFRAYGVSINAHEPESALRVTRSGRIDSLQLVYNVFDQSPENELFGAARQHDVASIVRVPLDEGSLGGKFTKQTRFADDDFRARYFRGERIAETVDRVEKLRPILENEQQTLAQGALRFCLSNEAVTTVIVGSTKPEHVRANAAVSDMGALDRRTVSELRAHAWPHNYHK